MQGVAFAILGCGQDSAAPSPPAPRITDRHELAFISDRNGVSQVYVVERDGANPLRVASDTIHQIAPRWSPDGSRLAYLTRTLRRISMANSYFIGDLFLIVAANGSAVNVTQDTLVAEESVTWSPDGSRLALQVTEYVIEPFGTVLGFPRSDIIRSDGSPTAPFSLRCGADPAWSPDGTRIVQDGAATCNSSELRGRLVVVDEASNQVVLEPPEGQEFFFPQWAPGTTILCLEINEAGRDLATVNPDGTGVSNLTNNPGWIDFDGFDRSPDGTTIVFARSESQQPEDTNIFRINADGSDLVQLTTAPGGNNRPRWSSDGTLIAFESGRDGNAEIYVMNPDGSNQTNVTRNPAQDVDFDWR
jgi:TolB protein